MYDARFSGILLAVSSLPGPYGIGSLGASARRFVDFLSESGQSYWQILPLVPLGHGNSPYMSTSAFAGNPLLIDLDELAAQGLLTTEELESARCENPDRVDYEHLNATRISLLRKAFERYAQLPAAQQQEEPDLPWLADYARFAALHDQYDTSWEEWPEDAQPDPDGVAFHIFLQDTFYRQWFHLKEYANQKHIRIMGDIPFYLSADSVERWSHPELFQLDEDGHLANVAGVPPDAFTADGQFWGNPLYDWKGNKKEVFHFWRERITWCARLYDAIRIDHFRAFHTYWSIPADAETAKEGHWEPGPGMELLKTLQRTAPELELIAEDLGDLDADALKFVRTCGIPGMKVLVFAFDHLGESAYLPHNCEKFSVVYTGTHDTPTFMEFLTQGNPDQARFARQYLRLREDEGLGWGLIAGAWASGSYLAMAPLQDVLSLGADARMNTPGTSGDHNWSWRVRMDAFNPYVSGKLREITRTYRRCL